MSKHLNKENMNTGIIISIALSSLSLMIGIAILTLLYTNNALSGSNCNQTEHLGKDNSVTDVTDTNTNLGSHKLISRTHWGAKPALSYHEITSPISMVIIKHSGGGTCFTFEACARNAQTIQYFSLSNGLPDIQFSFLIGGDGNVYVGRGWDNQLDQTPNAVDIVFLGNYEFDVLTDSMIEAAHLLLEDGVERNKLRKDYKLVAQNQTRNTASPGRNVYKEIIKWSHYDPYTGLDSATNEKLHTVSRFQWLAQPPTHELDPLKTPVPLVIIHHTATESCNSSAQCVFQVRHIQQFHLENRQWWDIGYNFLVGGDGAVYEGRGWKYEGAHTLGYNDKSIGVAFLGTFNSQVPPKNQIAAFKQLVEKGVELKILPKDYKILGAGQLYGTESPGEVFLKEIETWPHWVKEP